MIIFKTQLAACVSTHLKKKFAYFTRYLLGRICEKEGDIKLFRFSW